MNHATEVGNDATKSLTSINRSPVIVDFAPFDNDAVHISPIVLPLEPSVFSVRIWLDIFSSKTCRQRLPANGTTGLSIAAKSSTTIAARQEFLDFKADRSIQPSTGEILSSQLLPDNASFFFAKSGTMLISSTGAVFETAGLNRVGDLTPA